MGLRDRSSSYMKELIAALDQSDQSHALVLLPEELDKQIQRVKAAFPTSSLHSVAVKTNPLLHSLKYCVEKGMALECASAGEVELAIAAGAESTGILWDSPAKTVQEIKRFQQTTNMWIQVDSLEELELHAQQRNPKAKYALRITPPNLSERNDELNVSGKSSKFGIQLSDASAIVSAFKKYPFVKGIHIHGSSMEFDTSTKVNQLREVLVHLHREASDFTAGINFINIGGGLGYDYSGNQTVDLKSYADGVLQVLREYKFTDTTLLTEFGRFYHAPYSDSVSRIEYVKGENLILHFGADAFLREAYSSNPISFGVTVFNPEGKRKSGETETYKLCGPLCFGGDVIQKNVPLPKVERGDYLVIHETGANTFSLWSRHCSRRFPSVYQWDDKNLTLVKESENYDDIVKFWS